MQPISAAQLEHVIAIIGTDGITDAEIEAKVAALFPDPMSARRAIDWLPEAFGLVLIGHMAKVTLPTTFRARSKHGQWVEFALDAEPVFKDSLRLGTDMYHSGPRNVFTAVAQRSSLVAAVNKALHAGHSIDGATLSGPALIGIPAEVYRPEPPSLWRRLFG
ncbi:MAG TPA: hypothetical protein VLF18_15575 [Tahibacter sp.]|uniref:hypothetical protein n=1 Tax=Tahibacter sp. TaxID=2056211 RepID=UPI002C84163E|nr:hypothetical protein [Tahibacter sp.]HSX61620.1 hypothetical protein [Tahibacter sp.]